MIRTSPSPRRSSRKRKTNQFFSDDMWLQPEDTQPQSPPLHASPRPTTPSETPPSIPHKQRPSIPLRTKTARIPVFRDTASSAQSTSFTSFSFTKRSGNSRDVITITDEEDAVLSMDISVLREKLQCTMCATKMRNSVFVPCGHFVTCARCADVVAAKGTCVCCKSHITSVIRTKYD